LQGKTTGDSEANHYEMKQYTRWEPTRWGGSKSPTQFHFLLDGFVDLNLSSLLPQLSNPNYQEQNEYPSVQFAAREGAYNGSFAKRPLEFKTIANNPNISIQHV